MSVKPILPALLVLALSQAVSADPPSRAEIVALENHLDEAVSRVSRPAGLLVLGLPGTRAYRISGMGVVFVLPPRALDIARREVRLIRGSRKQTATAPLPEDELRVLEQQIFVFAAEAETTRRTAEQHADAVERQIRVRLSPVGAEEPTDAGGSRPPAAPIAPPAPAPPWLVWLQATGEREPSLPGTLVENVKAAVIDTIESHGARLKGVRGHENIAVAVDFVAPGEPFAPPERQRTMVVRVGMQALLDRAQGRLTAENLRKAFIVDEY